MKLKAEVIITETDGGYVAINSDAAATFQGMVNMNKTAGYLALQLRGEKTEEELISLLSEKYEIEKSVAERNVKRVIEGLKKADFIAE